MGTGMGMDTASGIRIARAAQDAPLLERAGTDSTKWSKYAGRDILPFWVADMDLPSAPCVLGAIRERLEHPILGYASTPPQAVDACIGWLARSFGWQVEEEWLVWLPGVVPGFNLAARAAASAASAGSEVLIPTPVYPPFLRVAEDCGLAAVHSPLVRGRRWEMDFDDLAAKMSPATAAVLFCNPHNPTGRVYDGDELRALAELAVERDTLIVSDEIHCPLVLDPAVRHQPIATLDAAVARRSITLFAPTKGFNFPGLGVAVAVIPDAGLRERFAAAARCGLVSGISPLAYAAATAAFADTSPWLAEQNAFLAGNAAIVEQVAAGLDGIATTPVEATCLAWLDVSALGLRDPAAAFERMGLGLSDGAEFGAPGFLRFNFGCPRQTLQRGIERLIRGVDALPR